jgi:HD-GYP domain-containing protein (c-di-GMP phosphodiesterase class II)
MRLVGINRLEPGAVLGRDVLTGQHGDLPLLAKGMTLEPRYVEALKSAGINAVYVDDEIGAGIDVHPVMSEQTRAAATEGLERAFGRARRGLESGEEALPDQTIGELASIVQMIADAVASCGDAVLALQDLAVADAYTLQHSIDVTALGLLITQRHAANWGWIDFRGAQRYDKLESRLVQLGLGLMLHDIGKVIVPAEVLGKSGPLDDAEWELIRRHPLAGLDLLSPASVGPLARSVIRSHHERWDGSGYPEGRAGQDIHQFARIAAVADVYDAVTSERPYSDGWAPHDAWNLIVSGAGTTFDAEVVAAFRHTVAPFPPGAEIVLDDGRRGVVCFVAPEALEHPIVRVGWDANGRPVRPYEIQLDRLPGAQLAA